jgi:hypothetical protein
VGKGVGMPAALKLEHFGRVLYEFFGHRAYQVGSSLKCSLGQAETWRDVDVRMILPDEEFDDLFGMPTRPRCQNLKWNAACLAFAALGRDMTDLPIDFQIDRQTEANEEYPGPRSALGVNLAHGIAYAGEVAA